MAQNSIFAPNAARTNLNTGFAGLGQAQGLANAAQASPALQQQQTGVGLPAAATGGGMQQLAEALRRGQPVASHPTNAAAWGFAPGFEQNATGNIIGMTGQQAFGGTGNPWFNENGTRGLSAQDVAGLGQRVLHRNQYQPPQESPQAQAVHAAQQAKQAYLENYWNNLKTNNTPTAYDALPLEQQSLEQLRGNQQYLQNQLNTYNANYGEAAGGVSNQQKQLMDRLAQIQALLTPVSTT